MVHLGLLMSLSLTLVKQESQATEMARLLGEYEAARLRDAEVTRQRRAGLACSLFSVPLFSPYCR